MTRLRTKRLRSLTEPTELVSAYYRVRRIIYKSTSQIGDDPAELDRLVEASCIRNSQSGVTGILWFDGASFVQVLEGDAVVITDMIDRIRIDTRHTDIQIIADREVTTRMFGSWGMRHPDTERECIEETAFLVGYAAKESPKLAQEILEIISESSG